MDMTDPVKFLVVDALAGVQTFARQLLQGYGFAPDSILCCADPDAALAQGLGFKPDLLITDWFAKSPLTGPALFERLKLHVPALRVALLSFEITPAHEAQAAALGSHFLLKKPFTGERLQGEMGRALDALAKSSPELHLRLTATMRTSQPKGELPRVALPVLPPEPVIKPGDQVRYSGALHTVQYVVHRQGETALQLKGQAALVPAFKVTPA
jgi:CheY-like chemotaxis protein